MRAGRPPPTEQPEIHASSANVNRPPSPRGSSTARSTTAPTSSSVSGCSCSTSDRDSSGETTEKDGFSVVAATSMMVRSSTAPSSESCWVLENRCTSSMNSTVCSPVRGRPACVGDDRADLLDAGRQRGQLGEPATGRRRDQRRQRGLTGARRAVEQHRRRAPDPSTSRRSGAPRPEQVVLADDLVQSRRPHPHGQRGRGADGARGASGRGGLAGDVEKSRRTRSLLTTALRR